MVEETPNHWVQQSTLWLGGTDGSQPRLLGEERNPRLSPDGRWIAFNRKRNAFVVASNRGRPWLVARNALAARWSPDSRYLATAEQGRALYVTDVETRRRVTIDRGATIYGASFSPSGKEIVWARKRGQGYVVDGGVDLFLARVDGSRRIRLTRTGRSSSPVWGRRGIAFSRVQPSGDAHFPIYELWMMRPRGGGAPTIDTSQPLSDRMVS
jgi:Tol biopolymer transport system component